MTTMTTSVVKSIALMSILATCCTGMPSGFYPDATTDQPFICDYRKLAWEFAKSVQPSHDTTLTFDALMLGSICNMTRPTPTLKRDWKGQSPMTGCNVFVALNGSNGNTGTSWESPLLDPSAGIAMARKISGSKTVCLGSGTFYLVNPLVITPADSNVRIQGAADGSTWLSGATPLPKLEWTAYKVNRATNGTLTLRNNTNNQAKCIKDNSSAIFDGQCGCFNETYTVEACVAKCKELGADVCTSFGWSGGKDAPWSNQCCIHADGLYTGNPQNGYIAGIWQGKEPARNIWKASIPENINAKFPRGPQLRVNGGRSSRARFPNANPELDQWPVGWAEPSSWLPPKPYKSKVQFVDVYNSQIHTRNHLVGVNVTLNYTGGIGGPCENFVPPFSYWCSANPVGGGGFQYYVPGGMTVPEGTFPSDAGLQNWTAKGRDATFQTFRSGHWASWMFDVDEINSTAIKFGAGGYQGCRGGRGDEWFVENVLELLDAPGEHFFDTATSTLYYYPNSSTAPPPGNVFLEVPVIQTLLLANSTQNDPIKNVALAGIGFRDAAPTYMEPHGVPSGGDWGLERLGAVYLEGTEGFTIDGCDFQRNDGNGVMISGYNRGAAITNTHFVWTGGTAIASWGRTDEISDGGIHGWDATAGDIPQGTRVESCIMRESGIWEKQSSCWFQAKTAGSTLLRNLCFNLPRAGFNFNDGAAGGDEVHENLIFNACRETSDHGPINSWDRQPYVTKFGIEGPGVATAHMIPRNLSYNFLVSNYGAGNGGIDNDDQSIRFENNHNFLVYGHQKFKVGAIRLYGNVMAYWSDFGGSWKTPGPIPDEPNVMYDNYAWIDGNLSHYHNDNPTEWIGNRSYNNHLVGINVMVGRQKTLPEWQALNSSLNDVNSTWENITLTNQSSEIMAAARNLFSHILNREN